MDSLEYHFISFYFSANKKLMSCSLLYFLFCTYFKKHKIIEWYKVIKKSRITMPYEPWELCWGSRVLLVLFVGIFSLENLHEFGEIRGHLVVGSQQTCWWDLEYTFCAASGRKVELTILYGMPIDWVLFVHVKRGINIKEKFGTACEASAAMRSRGLGGCF